MRADTDIAVLEQSNVSDCLEQLAKRAGSMRPLSTYRLQFHAGFRFEDARRLVPYLRGLGISHVYSSPILRARAGSMHGYDIVNHNELNPEIGTEAGFQAFVSELKANGMALVLDTVPNHMGVGRGENPWWQDVLQNGRTAEHADFFDIDWQPLKPELRNKVLLPILGNQYGDELEEGRIRLTFEDGEFRIRYYETLLPLDPRSIPKIFDGQQDFPEDLTSLLADLAALPPHWESDPVRIAQRRQLAPVLLDRLRQMTADPTIAGQMRQAAARMNGDPAEPSTFDQLHELLEMQAFRLAHWRVSAEEINYRRFFDINDLVGLRMENPRVFAETHGLLRRLLANGSIAGVRIDHPDGMLNPRQYFTRLQMLYAASQCYGATSVPPLADNGIELEMQNAFGQTESVREEPPLYCVVEKILEPGEPLPTEWSVDGTSGYEFTNLVNGITIAGHNERAFTELYHKFTGEIPDFDSQLYLAKKNVMRTAMAGEVNVLAHLLDELSSTDRHARDYTRQSLRDAIRETIACFPIYRCYIDERGEINDRDRAYIHYAINRAKRLNSGTAGAVFDFLRSILLLEGDADTRSQRLFFTLKFQQLTGPVMAKGMEDTVCYTYNRLISVNEVGSSPKDFGISLDEFHVASSARLRDWPNSMLATSTHDTKRSEDVRARINVLTENPRMWSQAVMRWRRSNAKHKVILPDGRVAPDANEEYLLYQTLVGSWPFDIEMRDPEVREQYIGRISAYMEKALHEAKVNLSWINPDPAYVEATKTFIRAILSPGRRGRHGFFLQDMQSFLPPVQFFGALNSLAQALLKLTSPGVPDIYQGNELFDFSLVDPDNRRPVDFASRERLLSELQAASYSEDASLPGELVEYFFDGRIKLWTTMRALQLRRDNPEPFRNGSYIPVHAAGGRREHLLSFARTTHHSTVITAVPRFAYTLMRGRLAPPHGDVWSDTELLLPVSGSQHFENVLTREVLNVTGQRTLLARDVFANFPVALLVGR